MSEHKVLSICIPTFNRAEYLDTSLKRVFSEIKGKEHLIDVYVSNNASTDATEKVVEKYQNLGLNIIYSKQLVNLGTEKNFSSLYERITTEYFWLLSDDDHLVPGIVDAVLALISDNKYGIIHIKNQWVDELPAYIAPLENIEYSVYEVPVDFIERVNYWITFISGNIINKYFIQGKEQDKKYLGTMLNYLGWYLPAIFQGSKNAVIENIGLICKANNSGGYKLFKVFGKNFNYIMNDLIKIGYDKRMKNIINCHLLSNFFPMFLNSRNDGFEKEKYMTSMLPVFWKYKLFWKNIFPTLLKQQLNIK